MKQLAVLSCLLGLLAGCDRPQETPPERVLTAYLEAAKAGDWKAAYTHISAKDRAVKTQESYRAELTPENALAAALKRKTAYKVTTVEALGERAIVGVEVTSPDLTAIYAGMMGSAFASVFDRQDGADVQELIAERLRVSDLPMRKHSEHYALVYEDRTWRVFFDWARQKQVEELLAEAEQLRREGDLLGALDRYEAVLRLDEHRADARKARYELSRQLALLSAKRPRGKREHLRR